MERPMRFAKSLALLIFAAASTALLPCAAFADTPCSGHELLSAPRPQGSCQNLEPKSYTSPDKKLKADVFPADLSLNDTPDMESRVEIHSSAGAMLASKDYSSPDGATGYYVFNAKWSPDSQYFVFSMMSSGGHSPWSFPIMVYSAKKNQFAQFSAMINSQPTLSGQFTIAAPHSLNASTWKQPGDLTDKVPVTVDLDAAFAKLPATAN
jgi:hypothetical protein